MPTPDELLAVLERRPCGAALLAALREVPDAWLVGGAARDLLLGREPHELDVVVEGDPGPLVARLGGEAVHHDRFGTAVLRGGDCRYDVVRARAESYAAPGALPDVRPGTLDEDLVRRDFTVNAIAVRPGALRAVPHALEDLEAGRLRVLHDGSFRDDPTRLWRLVRYAVRLAFLPEEETGRLARAAVDGGALATVSGDRLGNELRLALDEPDPLGVLHAAQQLALVAGLRIDPGLVAAAHALRPAREGDPRLVTLGAVIPDAAWAAGWGFDGAQERVLARCATLPPVAAARPSEVRAALDGEPVEAICVAGARGDVQTALRYLSEWRHVRLEITGDDLLAAGIAPGPELGERLRRALAAKVDGEVSDRSSELSVALSLSSGRMEEVNALQWNGRPGHYEVYYLSATDRATGTGLWIRSTMRAPSSGPAECHLWFMAMTAGGERFARKETYPVERLVCESDPFRLAVADSELSDRGYCGAMEGVSWDLTWSPNGAPAEHVHPLLRRAKIAKTILVLPHPDLAVSGTVRFGDTTLTLDRVRGGQAHLWGSKHALRWAWVHCNDFVDADTGEPCLGDYVDGVSVIVPRFGREIGPSTPVVGRFGAEDFRSTSPVRVIRNPSRFDLTSWRFEAVDGARRVVGEVDAPRPSLVGVTYDDPDGENVWCYNSEVATMRLAVQDKTRDGWTARRTLVADGTAHFEYAQRSTVDGIELLVT